MIGPHVGGNDEEVMMQGGDKWLGRQALKTDGTLSRV